MTNYIKMHANDNRMVFNDTGNIFVPRGTAAFKMGHLETAFPIYDCTNTATYDAWFENYAKSGANYLRIRLPHASNVSNDVCRGVESPPLDYFDIADVVPTAYTDLGNPDVGGWGTKVSNSNITAMLTAAEKYEIYIGFILFYEISLKTGQATWARNPYYRNCAYAFDGSACPASHKGTIDNPLEFFIPEADLIRDYSGVSNPWTERGVTRGDALGTADRQYITGYYQQRYLNMIMDEWGDSIAIAHWETMCEIQWIAERESVHADKLAAAELYVPWCEAVASYIRSIDPYSGRPVVHSDVRFSLSGNYDFYILKEGDDTKVRIILKDLTESEVNYADQSDYNKFRAVHNSLFYDSDLVQWHNYEAYTLTERRDVIRMLQKVFPGKPYLDGEYWSDYWEGPGTYEYTYPPYADDRQYMWVSFICAGAVGVASRMIGRVREDDSSDPDDFEFTELDPTWYTEYTRPLGEFMTNNGFNVAEWNSNFANTESIDDDLGGVSFGAAQGDDNQVIAIIQGGSDNITLTIDNMSSGFYKSEMYDYLTGNLVDTFYDWVTGTQLSLSLDVSDSNLDVDTDGYARSRIAIIYVKNRAVVPHTTTVVQVN